MTKTLVPSFFIIGERKCGTSSLYRYILEHPQVLPGERKEMQFFSQGSTHVEAHFEDYLHRFPSAEGTQPGRLVWPELDSQGVLYEEEIEYPREPGVDYCTGEASADTFAEVPPALLQKYLPQLRLILLLRDPVERVFSHHRMLRRFQEEGRELPHPVGDFASDMRSEIAATAGGKPAPLLSLGIYEHNLEAWTKQWEPGALLVLFTRDLQDPVQLSGVMEQVSEHLALPPWPPLSEGRPLYNQAPLAQMPESIRSELEDFYRPHNRALRDALQRDLPWMEGA